MCSDVAIKVENLSKCFKIYDKPQDRLLDIITRGRKHYGREFWALKNLSFEVKKGETVAIIGRNGSGKSTLLQMICGTLNPTSGTITTHGRIAALLELGSGFNPEFSGRENVYTNATVLGLTQKEINARFEDILAFADIKEFIDQPVKTYSSGMMLRLAFSVIAHVNADILIIDEALAVGDAFFTQKCMRFLRNFMKTGAVLFVSHDTSAVKSLCDRAIWLDKGLVLEQGSPKRICELYLEAYYQTQQVKKSKTESKLNYNEEPIKLPMQDQRLAFINNSNLRNDLQVFQFNSEAPSFGTGGAQIIHANLLDVHSRPLSWIVGGEKVVLRIIVQAFEPLHSPIIGFLVRDKLGQLLFGDNTYFTYCDDVVPVESNQQIATDFVFYMPILIPGDYSITVAVANGTQLEHVQHHWIHDAICFKSEASSVSAGIVGIPMEEIKLYVLETEKDCI